ncbi:hypothetical protein ACQPUZ_00625 [Clostridium tertium]
MLKEYIEKYNSWVYSLAKPVYVFLILITCILETLALSLIPSIIDRNYSNIGIKFITILIAVSLINFPICLIQYKKVINVSVL